MGLTYRRLYRIRVSTAIGGSGSSSSSGPTYVTASIPARCWVAASSTARLTLSLLSPGQVAGVAFDVPCGPGVGEPAGAEGQGPVTFPREIPVQLELPHRPHAVRLPLPNQQSAVQAQAAADAQARLAAQQEEAQVEGQGEGEGGTKGKKQPPKDERTWLQKNWMMLLGVGLLVSEGGSL